MIASVLGPGRVGVMLPEGLEIPVSVGELMLADPDMQERLSEELVATARANEPVTAQPSPVKKRSTEVPELDLHIEELVERPRGLSNSEMLRIQLEYFEMFMAEAMQNRWPKVVVIHGVGEGVLRAAVRERMAAWPHVSYHDASYTKYGYGATEILIRYGGGL